MIRALIVDDERLARSNLRRRLGEFAELEVVAEAQDADEAEAIILAERPDVVFLDVEMPGRTGFELLETLDKAPLIVFTTAYDEYALKAFEANALDYLLKPVSAERLRAAIQKIAERLNASAPRGKPDDAPEQTGARLAPDDRVFVRDGERCWFVPLRDIRLFESEGSYARLYFAHQKEICKPLILRSLHYLEERLDDNLFFRASRKHIVNTEYIERVETRIDGGLTMTVAGVSVAVVASRRQAQRFKEIKSL